MATPLEEARAALQEARRVSREAAQAAEVARKRVQDLVDANPRLTCSCLLDGPGHEPNCSNRV